MSASLHFFFRIAVSEIEKIPTIEYYLMNSFSCFSLNYILLIFVTEKLITSVPFVIFENIFL